MSTHLPPNIGYGVRRFLPVLLFTMFVAGAGCPSSDPGSADLDSEERAAWSGVDLTVAVPSGQGYRSRWPVLFEDWSARTGGSVSISAAAPSPREGGDIVVISITDVPVWDASGRLAEIQGTGLPVEELFDGLKKQVVSLGRVPRLVPIVLPTLVLYLRADLLESAGRSAPRTWLDYQELLDSIDQWGGGLPAVEPWGPDFRVTMFLARAVTYARHPANYSLFFDINNGNPLIDSPPFVRGLTRSRTALARMPAVVKTFGPADCRREFLAGRAAMAIAYEPGGHGDEVLERDRSLRIRFARLPGVSEGFNRTSGRFETVARGVQTTPLVGFSGWVAAVPATGEVRREAAWDLVGEILHTRRRDALGPVAAGPCWRSDVETAVDWLEGPLAAEERIDYVEVTAASLDDSGLVLELPLIGRQRFKEAIAVGLKRWLDNPDDPGGILGDVAQEWRKILEQIGHDAARDSYRRGIGLSARRR
ncbi:MAG: hypothetical protein VB859_11750 [Planctomycetaceae bacterium]